MCYPKLASTIKNQLTRREWDIVKEEILQGDSLTWHQDAEARPLLESAARKAVLAGEFPCAEEILRY